MDNTLIVVTSILGSLAWIPILFSIGERIYKVLNDQIFVKILDYNLISNAIFNTKDNGRNVQIDGSIIIFGVNLRTKYHLSKFDKISVKIGKNGAGIIEGIPNNDITWIKDGDYRVVYDFPLDANCSYNSMVYPDKNNHRYISIFFPARILSINEINEVRFEFHNGENIKIHVISSDEIPINDRLPYLNTYLKREEQTQK